MEEFENACLVLSQHSGVRMTRQEIREMAQCIDINKDGSIDFSEFLEAFRIVDKLGRANKINSQNDRHNDDQ